MALATRGVWLGRATRPSRYREPDNGRRHHAPERQGVLDSSILASDGKVGHVSDLLLGRQHEVALYEHDGFPYAWPS